MKTLISVVLLLALTGCYRPVLDESDKFFIKSVTEASINTQASVDFVYTADNFKIMRMTLRKCATVFDSLLPNNEDYEYCEEFVDSSERMVNTVEYVLKTRATRDVI